MIVFRLNFVSFSDRIDLQLCDTYPQCLFVPTSVSTIVLVGSASFRSKGRLPVLTYLHKNQVCNTAGLAVTSVIDNILSIADGFQGGVMSVQSTPVWIQRPLRRR
jgi:hypothetical protein